MPIFGPKKLAENEKNANIYILKKIRHNFILTGSTTGTWDIEVALTIKILRNCFIYYIIDLFLSILI